MKKNTQILRFASIFLLCLLMKACATSAPSNYELNRRSGLDITRDKGETKQETLDRELKNVRTGTAVGTVAKMPARLPPVVEKIWVYDQIVNDGQWLQGTWIFVEVDEAKWLPEIDSGSGSFLDTKTIKINSGS